MDIFYWIGYAIVFVFILLFGTWILINEDDRDILDMLISLFIMPFFSWLVILIVLIAGIMLYYKEKDNKWT